MRSLAKGTIKSHFAKWILSGEINLPEVLETEKIKAFEKFIDKHGTNNYAAFKAEMADYDYADLRMVINHVNRTKKVE